MSTDLAPIVAASPDELEQLAVLLGLDPRRPATKAMVMVCHRYGLDPLLKHVVVIPNSGPYITRDGLLHVAHRSGVFDGIELVDGPRLEDRQWVASVRVWRKDMTHAFTYPGRYPTTGSNSKFAPEMAIKVAECMALRRAFDIAGLPVLEERQVGDVAPWDETPGEAAGSPVTPPPPATDATDPDAITGAQRKKLWAQLKRADMGTEQVAKAWMSSLLGREINSTGQLTKADGMILLDELKLLIGRKADRSPGDPAAVDEWTVDAETGEVLEPEQTQ